MLRTTYSSLSSSVRCSKNSFANVSVTYVRHMSSSSDDGKYLNPISKVPTLHFQPSLPRLPIPPLEKTCQRYLNAQTPLLDDTSFENTNKFVSDFLASSGKELNNLLIAQDMENKHTSYVTEPWFDMYLKDRKPIVLNYNPFVSYIDDTKAEYNDPVIRAANFIVAAARFRESLLANVLEPEIYHMNPKKSDTDRFRSIVRLLPSSISWYGAYLFKAFPLDMSQYPNLFNTTRIPQIGKDKLVKFDNAKHMLVIRGGHFYVFDIFDKNGGLIDANDIHACLEHIRNDPISPAEHPIGYLTAEDRDTWAEVRRLLMEHNSSQLEAIDGALFNLALDDVSSDNDPVKMTKLFLHGDAANRWFDKSFTLIMTRDGKAAVNFEHSWGDGVAVMRFINESLKDSTQRPSVHPGAVRSKRSGIDPTQHVRRLDFQLSDRIKTAVSGARQRFQQSSDSLAVDIFLYEGFSKAFCKEKKVSPDAIMQLGFQLAYHLQNGSNCATYEACSTSAFKRGRTETIRPCTIQTTNFCRAITSSAGKHSPSELKAMINSCSTVHGQLTKEAAMGEGFDRHLFALKYLAEQHSLEVPGLYHDPAYASINHNILSTSTLSSPAVELGGFAPVVRDGYGLGYSIQDYRVGAVVTTYRPHRNGSDYVSCLHSAFQRIEQVLRQ